MTSEDPHTLGSQPAWPLSPVTAPPGLREYVWSTDALVFLWSFRASTPLFLLHRLVLTTHQKKRKLTLPDAPYLCFNDQITPVDSPKSQTFGTLLRYFF